MKKTALGFAAIAVILSLGGCAAPPQNPAAALSPLEAKDWLAKNPSAQLVDVRTPEEYAEAHIAGSKLIPVQELEGRLGEIKKESPVLLYCHSGRRSQKAFDLLKEHGFKDLRHIGGGITAWKEQGLPVAAGAK